MKYTEQYLCQSFYDNGAVQDCTCGKCGFLKGHKYLCAIGSTKTTEQINDYRVAIWDGNLFSFTNGSYSNTELNFREQIGSNITTVLKAKLIDDIDF